METFTFTKLKGGNKMKTTKLGHTNFLGSPKALKEKTHEKILSYKKGMAKIKKMRKHERTERMKKIKSVQVKYF